MDSRHERLRSAGSALAIVTLVAAAAGCSSGQEPGTPDRAAGPPAAGARLWVQRYDSGADQPDVAGSVVAAPRGDRVFVTGSAGTVAYRASTGTRLWTSPGSAYAGSGGSTPPPTAAVSPRSDRVFVTGTSQSRPPGPGPSGGDWSTTALDARTGATLWSASYDGPAGGDDGAQALAVSPDGRLLFVHGTSEAPGTGADLTTVAYDTATGRRAWVARYDGPGHGAEMYFPAGPQSVTADPRGRFVVVTGGSQGTRSLDYATVAYDATTGRRLWTARYDGPARDADLSTAVAVTPDGTTVVATGSSVGTGTQSDVATVGYAAATGRPLWVRRYDGPASRNEGAGSIAVSPSTGGGARVYVSGVSEGPRPEREDIVTLAYGTSDGQPAWSARWNGPADRDDNGAALAATPDGRLVLAVGSTTDAQGHSDFVTVAYDAGSGAVAWTARYDGGGLLEEGARSVATGRGHRAFVTGTSADDYATLAYRW